MGGIVELSEDGAAYDIFQGGGERPAFTPLSRLWL